MLQSLFRDSFLYTLSTLLTRGMAFFLLPVYTRVLSPGEFGVLDYLTALSAIAAILVTLEIMQGLARHIPDYLNDVELKRRHASTCLWFVAGTYSAMLACVWLYREPLAHSFLGDAGKSELMGLAALSCWVAGLLNVVHGQLRWELKSGTSALLSLLSAVITIACTLLLVVWLRWGVAGAIWAQVLGGMLALLPSLYLTRSSFGWLFDKQALRSMLAFSVPLMPSSLAVVFALYFDRLILKDLLGLEELGVYAVGQKISLVVTLALVGFRSALTPLIYAHHARPSTPSELAQIFQVFCLAALAMVLGLSVFAEELLALIAGPAYQPAAKVVPLLIFSVLLANMYIFAPGLDIHRRTGTVSAINLGVAGLSLALNYLLIPYLGIVGAALASLLSFGFGFCLYMHFSQRLYPVPHDWATVTKLFLLVLAGVGLKYGYAHAWSNGFPLKLALMLVILTLMARASGFSWSRVATGLSGLAKK